MRKVTLVVAVVVILALLAASVVAPDKLAVYQQTGTGPNPTFTKVAVLEGSPDKTSTWIPRSGVTYQIVAVNTVANKEVPDFSKALQWYQEGNAQVPFSTVSEAYDYSVTEGAGSKTSPILFKGELTTVSSGKVTPIDQSYYGDYATPQPGTYPNYAGASGATPTSAGTTPTGAGASAGATGSAYPDASVMAQQQANLAYLQQKIDGLQGTDSPDAQTYVLLQQNYRDAIDRGDWENAAGYEDQIKTLRAADTQSPGGAGAANTGEPFKDPKGAADSNKIADGAKAISNFLHQEYPGVASLGGMLVGAVPALSDWKAAVDKAFCDTIILGGKTCWVQKICESSSDYPGGDGTLVDSQWGNNTLTITFYAHVEGQRSQPVVSVNPDGTTKTEYLYKITYSIRNPQSKDANAYQLRFFYPGGSYDWYPTWQPLHKGDAISMTGNSALVAYSTRLYSRVCLIFQKSVEVNGQSTMQVCNTIVQYGGGATPIAGAPAAATSEQGAATGTPAAAGAGF